MEKEIQYQKVVISITDITDIETLCALIYQTFQLLPGASHISINWEMRGLVKAYIVSLFQLTLIQKKQACPSLDVCLPMQYNNFRCS